MQQVNLTNLLKPTNMTTMLFISCHKDEDIWQVLYDNIILTIIYRRDFVYEQRIRSSLANRYSLATLATVFDYTLLGYTGVALRHKER